MTKRCAMCKESHPVREFRRGQSYCTPCQNDYIRQRNYGLSREQYIRLLLDHKGLCAICKREMGSKPCIDHIHGTKTVRGLLCYSCNTALGKFQDSPEILRRAIRYLEREVK